VGITRACRQRPWGQAGDNPRSGLTPPCPHSCTRSPHSAARARPPIEDACGATTTHFLYFEVGWLDGGNPPHVHSIHPKRRFAPTVQFHLEQPSSLRRNRCPVCAGMAVQFQRNRHATVLSRAYHRAGVTPGSLVLPADNGGPMKGATLLATLQRLGVMPSFSRPTTPTRKPCSRPSSIIPAPPASPSRTWMMPASGWRALSRGTTGSIVTAPCGS
jgi:hypothetical protein